MDLASLAESIKNGRIAGAAVDVYPTEPEKNSDGFQTGADQSPKSVGKCCVGFKCSLFRHAITASSTALPLCPN